MSRSWGHIAVVWTLVPLNYLWYVAGRPWIHIDMEAMGVAWVSEGLASRRQEQHLDAGACC